MKSVSRYAATALAAAILAIGAGSARADTFTVNAYTGDLGGPFDAVTGSAALFTAANNSQEATFTYSGPLYFVNTQAQNSTASGDVTSQFFGANAANISGYVDDTAPISADYGDFGTLSGFLAASGSAAGYPWGTLDIITDTTQIAAGTMLTVTHDDGATFYDNGVAIPGTTAGPTTAVTETVTVPVTGTISLAYARENGTPSILTVSENVPVPEPITMSVLGAGLLGLGVARRSRR